MQKSQFKGIFMLFLTAFIWGSSFVAQSLGMESVEAFTFNGIRTLFGAAALLPFIIAKDLINIKKHGKPPKEKVKAETKKILIGGTVMGLALCIASNFQQYAFTYEDHSAGKIAFITAFYMFFVPLIGLLFRKRVPLVTWLCVIIGTVGLYFLCVGEEGFSAITKSDIFSFICSICYAVHILVIEKFAADSDAVKLSFTQFTVSGVITCIIMFIVETPTVTAINQSILPLLYSGIMSCGLAYTFQIIGQKYTESTVASLIMCLESVFGVLCGALFLQERLTQREIIGCVIMFAAIILSQFSEQIHEKAKTKRQA
ncbi:MAG: DMT family transporter [Clostridia bacterium]|nr:DMT family transporter [Clostridia bacterium]